MASGAEPDTPTARVAVADDVVYEVLDGEAVVLDLTSGTYFALNSTATRLWQLVERDGDVEKILEMMRAEYEVDPAVLDRDLRTLVDDLRAKGLLRAEPSAS
jgi:hypothetical protein